uniref:Tensin 1 n=1 Tax=Echinostoma caproni TaxID=27848 RepID=A0A183B668_9TREM
LDPLVSRTHANPTERYEQIPPSSTESQLGPLNTHQPLAARLPLSSSTGNVERGPSIGPSDSMGMSSGDSFEQLAAQAAAQLGVTTSIDPGALGRMCSESPFTDTNPLSIPTHYSNTHTTHFTSTPGPGAKASSIPGGVNVFPAHLPNQHPTQSVASPMPTTSLTDQSASGLWMDSQLNRDHNDPWTNSPGYYANNSSTGEVSVGTSEFTSQSSTSYANDRMQSGVVCPNRVSEKIQQLVNTLKRPKRRPLPEYFLDEEDQILVRQVTDPSAPRPRGPQSQPLRGEELVVPSGLPRNLESALQRYAGLSCKAPVLTCLDVCGRPTQVLTYAKLLQVSS